MSQGSKLKAFALGAGLTASALGLYALAATLNTFAPGDVVSSSKINENFTNLNTDITTLNAKFPVATANLADNAVATAKIADGAVSTAKIADGAVTAAKTADEPGFNRNYVFPSGLAGIPTTAGAITNVTLDAPAAGFAVVTATFQFVSTHTTGTRDESVFKLSKTAGDVDGANDPIMLVIVPAAYPTTGTQEAVIPTTITNTFAVVKGANTINLNGKANRDGLLINRVNLTAVYVPTRYGTGSTVN